MKVVIKGGCWHALKQMIALAVLAGLLLVLLTLSMPLANEHRDAIAERIATVIHHPLRIGYVDIRWEGFKLKPLVTFRDVEIDDPDSGKPILHFASMGIRFNPWRSLLHRRLEVDVVELSDSRLHIVRDVDDKISVHGFASGARRDDRPSLARILDRIAGMRFRLNDIVIDWDDRVAARHYRFTATGLDLWVGRDALALEADIVPPRTVGDRLKFKLLVEGPLDSPRQWNSRYFIEGEEVNLAGLPYLRRGVLSQAGSGTLDLKLWGSSQRDAGFDLQGSVALRNVRVDAPTTGDDDTVARFGFIDELAADLHLSGDFRSWRIDVDGLRVLTPEKHWPKGGFSIAWDDEVGAYFGVVDYLDIGSVRTIAALMPELSDRQLDLLHRLRPEGELRDIDFSLPRDFSSLDKFAFKARFDGIAWHEMDRIPGVRDISGTVLATADRGVAKLDSTTLLFRYPRLFANDIEARSLHAELSWERQADHWDVDFENLILANEDIVVRGGGSLQLGQGEHYPRLTMELIAPSAPLARVAHYLPYRILKEKPARWLRRAFTGGHAENIRLTYSGPVRKEAFKKRIAKMTAAFDVRDGSLVYHDEWPALSELAGTVRFDNSRLTADVASGKVMGATIERAKVEIDDLFLARLALHGQARGALPQALRFVRHSPLNRNLGDFLDKVESGGPVALDLDLDLTLSGKLKRYHRAAGVIELRHCEAAIPKQQLRVSEVAGKIRFVNNVFTAESLRGVFRDAPVMASMATTDDGMVRVLMEGRWAPADLLPQLRNLIAPVTDGVATWHGVLNLPRRHPGESKRSPWLEVGSRLAGVRIDLPAPLGKPAPAERALNVEYHFSSPAKLRVRVADLLDLRAEMRTRPRFSVTRATLALQEQASELPRRGIRVRGHWPEVDVAAWGEVIARYPKAHDPGRESVLDKVDDIDVGIGKLLVASQRFSGVSLRALRSEGQWQARIDSEDIAGKVVMPLPLGSSQVVVTLDRLLLQKHASRRKRDFDTRVLPPIALRSAVLKWGELAFRDLRLETRPRTEGLEISRCALATDYLDIDARGFWRKAAGAEHTSFVVTARGKDIGQVLRGFGLGDSLGSGSGVLSGKLGWPGAPSDYSLASLEADLEVELHDGWLRKIEPGLGRLIGLLSLDYLPRRLSLNFRDMEQEGFYYAALQGTAHIGDGILTTDDLLIDGPVAEFQIQGKTDLIRHSYDLALKVVPKLSASAPIAAGLIAGPQAGVAVFMLDKLAAGLGLDLNESVALDYTVTGSWAEPEIAAVNEQEPAWREGDILDYLD